MSDDPGFFSRQRAGMLVVALAAGGLGLLFLGQYLIDAERSILGTVVAQVSGVFITAAVGTVFFSLAEVRDHITRTSAGLLARGEFLGSLSAGALRALDSRVARALAGAAAESVREDLVNVCRQIRTRCLTERHLTDYRYEVKLEIQPGGQNVVRRFEDRAFGLDVRHLPAERRHTTVRYSTQLTIPPGFRTLDLQEIRDRMVLRWFCRIDEMEFDASDLEFSRVQAEAAEHQVRAEFLHELDLTDSGIAAVTFGSEMVVAKGDPVETVIATVPIHGLTFTLRLAGGHRFDGTWFKSWDPATFAEGEKSVRLIQNDGILAQTNDWVLPGEGVALMWSP